MADDPKSDEVDSRKRWFDQYVDAFENRSVIKPAEPGVMYRCPCCNCLTLDERGGYDICQVCFWEDDGQDDADADTVRGGPNYEFSLTQARKNYNEFGASSQRVLPHVRKPNPNEL